MQRRELIINWLVLAVLWISVAAAFVLLQREMAWTLFFPMTGLVWTAIPLVATTFPTRGLVVGSLATLATAIGIFLAMVWLAVTVLGFLVPLVVESASEPDGVALALELALEGLKVLPGAALGIGIGVSLRRPDAAAQASAG